MRILLTGSSGQLGQAIAEQLAVSHDLIGIDLYPGPWTQRIENIGNRKAVSRLVQEVDAVIHTASLHQPHLTSCSEKAFIEVNVTGTLNLLEAATNARIQRFVYTSTTSLYGYALQSWRQARWVTEALQPQPRDLYDRTKITAEQLCRYFALQCGLPTISLRVARFFSETPRLQILHRLSRGVDVRDAATAHVLAVTNQTLPCGIFNIAARSPFQQEDLWALRWNATQILHEKVPEIVHLFQKNGWSLPRSIDRVYAIGQAERYLGYRPAHNYRECIQQFEQKV